MGKKILIRDSNNSSKYYLTEWTEGSYTLGPESSYPCQKSIGFSITRQGGGTNAYQSLGYYPTNNTIVEIVFWCPNNYNSQAYQSNGDINIGCDADWRIMWGGSAGNYRYLYFDSKGGKRHEKQIIESSGAWYKARFVCSGTSTLYRYLNNQTTYFTSQQNTDTWTISNPMLIETSHNNSAYMKYGVIRIFEGQTLMHEWIAEEKENYGYCFRDTVTGDWLYDSNITPWLRQNQDRSITETLSGYKRYEVDGTVTYQGSNYEKLVNIDDSTDILRGNLIPPVTHEVIWKVDDVIFHRDTVEVGAAITEYNYTPNTGYSFSGWSSYPSVMPDNDVTVTGTTSLIDYTVTWTVDNETVHTDTLHYTDSITEYNYTPQSGYTFSGWSSHPATMPAENLIITGTTTAIEPVIVTHNITWKVDNVIVHTDNLEVGAAITDYAYTAPAGYTFSGWSSHPATMPDNDLIITGTTSAVQPSQSRTVKYYVENSLYRTYTDISVDEPAPVPPEPEVQGYVFSGWEQQNSYTSSTVNYNANLAPAVPASSDGYYIYGSFADKNNMQVRVYIKIPKTGQNILIGSGDEPDIYFDKDPVSISTEMDETMDVFIYHSCTIKLYIKKYMGDSLFSGFSRDVIVNVWKSGICLFAGFVEPNVYNQDYNHVYDKVTINCTDGLATLQYFPYKNIYTQSEYDAAKETANKITYSSIIGNIMSQIPKLDITNGRNNSIYYDGSIRVSASDSATEIFDKITVYELLFYGEEKDDLQNSDEIIEEILKYLDLHIVQDGTNFFIFNWQSIKNRQTINWYPICLADTYYVAQSRMVVRNSVARQALVSMQDESSVIPGNVLPTSYEDEIVYYDSAYINWQDATLPNQTKAKTGNYRLADLSDWDFLVKSKDSILKTSIYGDYDESQLRTAPAQCYENDQFKYPYYTVDDSGYIVADQ